MTRCTGGLWCTCRSKACGSSILASLLAYVLVKTTGVDREVIDKWMYLIIAFALMCRPAGYRATTTSSSACLATGCGSARCSPPWSPIPFFLLVLFAYNMVAQRRRNHPNQAAILWAKGTAVMGFLGAGVWGFMHTLAPVNYYTHATQLTAAHGHLAFYGAYVIGGDHHHQLRHAHLRGRLANSAAAQSMEKRSFWVMTIGMCVMVLALTIAGVMQSYLQRWLPEGQALSYMATQDELRGYYWLRVVGGVVFLIGQFMYFASFFIGGKHVESHADAMALKAA